MEIVPKLDVWFSERLSRLNVSSATLAYVVGVFARHRDNVDMSGESIVLAFRDAQARHDFASFQRIGDHVLWAETFCPQSVDPLFETVTSLARISYYRCYRIVGRTWPIYEELGDTLPTIAT